MNVFDLHQKVMADYSQYISSFIHIQDADAQQKVQTELFTQKKLWPAPILQFSPRYAPGRSIGQLIAQGVLAPATEPLFKGFSFYQHQDEALTLASQGKDFVVTSGTGSGKSLTYLAPIFSHLLQQAQSIPQGVQAIIVYPMNALVNSQQTEIKEKYAAKWPGGPAAFPVTYAPYTGQESQKETLIDNPPNLLLTNYMMLELLLTRSHEQPLRQAIFNHLQFLVFDELHTYRGRQGADVALLIRRLRQQAKADPICIGTSATMVSQGNRQQQQQAVAHVAGQVFGKPFTTAQIVQEAITYSIDPVAYSPAALHQALHKQTFTNLTEAQLRQHPMAAWLEREVAITNNGHGPQRATPLPWTTIVNQLLALLQTAAPNQWQAQTVNQTLHHFLNGVSAINQRNLAAGQRNEYLAHRLNQFISQTGTMSATLEPAGQRHLTFNELPQHQGKPLYPLVFSKFTGRAFYQVSYDMAQGTLSPRLPQHDPGNDPEQPHVHQGYVFAHHETDHAWANTAFLTQHLPGTWFKHLKRGTELKQAYQQRLPQPIWVNAAGQVNTETTHSQTAMPGWQLAWFMPAPLLLDPDVLVVFGSEADRHKLASIGVEGRSMATTLLTYRLLCHLNQASLPEVARKLLSFTDNRQDAALQAGHFNNFIDRLRLRKALYQALNSQAHEGSLGYDTVAQAVVQHMALQPTQYARQPARYTNAPINLKSRQALLMAVQYRLLADLKEDRRYILPNLEATGQLTIGYLGLDQYVDAATWQAVPLMNAIAPKARKTLLTATLDYFRYRFALQHNCYDYQEAARNKASFAELLHPQWAPNEAAFEPYWLRIEPAPAKGQQLRQASMGPQSVLGRYLKRQYQALLQHNPTQQELTDLITGLAHTLSQQLGLLSSQTTGKNNPVTLYRLNTSILLWQASSGQPAHNHLRLFSPLPDAHTRITAKANPFFEQMYQEPHMPDHRFRAREHTGQLGYADRTEAEQAFGQAQTKALYCSPTMELGVDVQALSVVHLRNAPPNPANYAQRAGRAGRSGQGALVFTYCGHRNPHDRHYFTHQTSLVAGAVKAPQLKLANQGLLKSHLHALCLTWCPIDELRHTVAHLLDLDQPHLPMKPALKQQIEQQIGSYWERIHDAFQDMLKNDSQALAHQAWLHPAWVGQVIDNFTTNLDQALGRWRNLYTSARQSFEQASQHMHHNIKARAKHAYDQQSHRAYQALCLLKNEPTNTGRKKAVGESEFYPYRYLAAEGFLPGYNFTPLPMRLLVEVKNGRSTEGEYIARPQALALQEFGPHNYLYHKGHRYRVNAIAPPAQGQGVAHTYAVVNETTGHITFNAPMGTPGKMVTGLVAVDNSMASFDEHIHCGEEARQRRGYQVETWLQQPEGQGHPHGLAMVHNNQHLFTLHHYPAARLVHINNGWRHKEQGQGFALNPDTGHWYSQAQVQAAQKQPQSHQQPLMVKPYVQQTADALYLEPGADLDLQEAGLITLLYALKQAIVQVFELEANEIGTQLLGQDAAGHPNLLFYEAAAGSLGVINSLAESKATSPDTHLLQQVAAQALASCHFDAHGQDTHPQGNDLHASYADLLSYDNQPHHHCINRHLITQTLLALQQCQFTTLAGASFQACAKTNRASKLEA